MNHKIWAFYNIHECPNCHGPNYSITSDNSSESVECDTCGFKLTLCEWDEEALRAAPAIWAKRQAEHYRQQAKFHRGAAIACDNQAFEIEKNIKQEKQS